nr:hypothetical protein [uncultured Lichenicoccus sp.]
MPRRVLASIQASHPFTVITGAQGVAGDLVTATVDRLHAAHIETTTIEAPLPSLAALTRAISTALSVVVDTERPLVVIVRQADALRQDAMLRLPALAGLQRGGRPVLCFLLMGRPALWDGLGTIGLGALEHDEAAHIRLATPAIYQPEAPAEPRRPEPPQPPPRRPFAEAPPAARRRRGRRARIIVPAVIVVGGAAVLGGLYFAQENPPAVPTSASIAPPAPLPPVAAPPAQNRAAAIPVSPKPAAPAMKLRPAPDLSAATPAPPAAMVPAPPALPDLPQAAPEPPAIPTPTVSQPVSPPPVSPPPVSSPPVSSPPAASAPATTGASANAPTAASAPPPPEARLVLPEAGMLHIVLRYSQGSDASQAFARRVAAMLRAAGANVDGPTALSDAPAKSSIGYFFNADRDAADRIAHRLPAHFVHIRSPFGASAGPMMRPGQLVVTIGSDSAAAN